MRSIEPRVNGFTHTIEVGVSEQGAIVKLYIDGVDPTEDALLSPGHAERLAYALLAAAAEARAAHPYPAELIPAADFPEQSTDPAGTRYAVCPGCGFRVNPGQSVVHVDDDDPWKCLWHRDCRAAEPGCAGDFDLDNHIDDTKRKP